MIGTLAAHGRRAAATRSSISTGDKDLAQLVDEHVTLINTMTNETLDVAGVTAKFGVPPERIVDYLALVGDAVDNVPGVEKVGPKTAAKWIAEYGSLDGVIAARRQIKGAVGENLRKALDWLPQGARAASRWRPTATCRATCPAGPSSTRWRCATVDRDGAARRSTSATASRPVRKELETATRPQPAQPRPATARRAERPTARRARRAPSQAIVSTTRRC